MERVNMILSNAEFRECIEGIERYEQDRIFCRHGLNHLLDTARIGYILILENKLDVPKGLVYAASLLHDIGRYDEYYSGVPHHKDIDRITSILFNCGYSNQEVSIILNAIYAHREKSAQLKTLGDVLSRADKLTRLCFDCVAKEQCYWLDTQKNATLQV